MADVGSRLIVLDCGIVFVRIAGKRTFCTLSAFDIVLAVNLSRALTGNAPFWPTLAATTVLARLHC